ncbi:MAG: hypothetical protein KBD55_00920 [Candidatus Pacebacteria bacterium]|nr:hypothetical protein [Candidatus Paceibacterota bacterium]
MKIFSFSGTLSSAHAEAVKVFLSQFVGFGMTEEGSWRRDHGDNRVDDSVGTYFRKDSSWGSLSLTSEEGKELVDASIVFRKEDEDSMAKLLLAELKRLEVNTQAFGFGHPELRVVLAIELAENSLGHYEAHDNRSIEEGGVGNYFTSAWGDILQELVSPDSE